MTNVLEKDTMEALGSLQFNMANVDLDCQADNSRAWSPCPDCGFSCAGTCAHRCGGNCQNGATGR